MMRPKNEIFAKALDWLYSNGLVDDQKDLSEKTGIDKTTISRILNDQVKKPSDVTLRKFNAAFDGIFNPQFLRGESDIMLARDVNAKPAELNPEARSKNQDDGRVIELLEEKNMLLQYQVRQVEESARREIAAKDENIRLLKEQIADKKALNQFLSDEVTRLKKQLEQYQQKYTKNSPFPVGVAEEKVIQQETNL